MNAEAGTCRPWSVCHDMLVDWCSYSFKFRTEVTRSTFEFLWTTITTYNNRTTHIYTNTKVRIEPSKQQLIYASISMYIVPRPPRPPRPPNTIQSNTRIAYQTSRYPFINATARCICRLSSGWKSIGSKWVRKKVYHLMEMLCFVDMTRLRHLMVRCI